MVKVNIIGLKEMQNNLNKYSTELRREVSAIVENGAKTFVKLSVRAAPIDLGVLRNGISYVKLSDLRFEVISQVRYSPYLEFGTITKVSVPGELQAYAAKFRGKGLRTTGGINPHPYFFPNRGPVKSQIEKQVDARLKAEKKI